MSNHRSVSCNTFPTQRTSTRGRALIYKLAYSAMALATSNVESLPPSPQLARRGGASPCRRPPRRAGFDRHVVGAHFAFRDYASFDSAEYERQLKEAF